MPAPVDGSLPAPTSSPAPTPGSPEKEAVRAMFDRIAPRYDLLNRVLSFGRDGDWRRIAVRMARPETARRVLDLACGTGMVACALVLMKS